jgi:hypothetical protein
MKKKSARKPRKPKSGPLSLWPMSFEQAVDKMFAAKPARKTPKRKR